MSQFKYIIGKESYNTFMNGRDTIFIHNLNGSSTHDILEVVKNVLVEHIHLYGYDPFDLINQSQYVELFDELASHDYWITVEVLATDYDFVLKNNWVSYYRFIGVAVVNLPPLAQLNQFSYLKLADDSTSFPIIYNIPDLRDFTHNS